MAIIQAGYASSEAVLLFVTGVLQAWTAAELRKMRKEANGRAEE